MKVSFMAGSDFDEVPCGLWQVWRFIAPGLYSKGEKLAFGFIGSGIVLVHGRFRLRVLRRVSVCLQVFAHFRWNHRQAPHHDQRIFRLCF